MYRDPEKHRRRSIRLRDYDYAQPGAYFVTIVAQDRANLFGEVVDGEMRLNDAGEMMGGWWHKLTDKFLRVESDQFIVMPNHFHGIIHIVGADPRVRPDARVPRNRQGAHAGAPLHTIVQWFKIMTTNEYIRGIKQRGWSTFNKRLWQRNYYEHIIRNEEELNRIRQYIATNPLRWQRDRENPERTGDDEFDRWLDSFTKTKLYV